MNVSLRQATIHSIIIATGMLISFMLIAPRNTLEALYALLSFFFFYVCGVLGGVMVHEANLDQQEQDEE